MGEMLEQIEMDLIDKKEYRKRYRIWVGKHSNEFQEFMNIPSENKVSWGTIIEKNCVRYFSFIFKSKFDICIKKILFIYGHLSPSDV